MNAVERYASENRNTIAIRFARPAIMLAIRHYRRLEKMGDLIRREVEPLRQKLVMAQSRVDEMEADHDLLETIKQANKRKTDSNVVSTPLDKYKYVYSIGKTHASSLAVENDPLTGSIIESAGTEK